MLKQWMRSVLLLTAMACMAAGEQLPVTYLAGARFRVGDVAKAREFYGKVFGFHEKSGTDAGLVAFEINGVEFVEFLLRGQQGSPDHLCFDVPDIQRAYQTLVQRGATTRGKPRIASNGHWVLNLADPNGLRIELMEPRPAAK